MPNEKRYFPVTLFLASNPTTGEEFLLRTDEEIEQAKQVTLKDYDVRDQVLTARVKQDVRDKWRSEFLAGLDANEKREKEERDAAMPHAQRLEFRVCKPSYGAYMKARGAGQKVDLGTGNTTWDNEAFLVELLPLCVKDLDEKELLEMSPCIVEELGRRVSRMISPDQRRLLFTAPPSTAS